MTYRAILVHVPLDEAQNQVELAASLAKEIGAHLTGMCSLPEVAILRSAGRNAFVKLEPAQIEELIKREYAEPLRPSRDSTRSPPCRCRA